MCCGIVGGSAVDVLQKAIISGDTEYVRRVVELIKSEKEFYAEFFSELWKKTGDTIEFFRENTPEIFDRDPWYGSA